MQLNQRLRKGFDLYSKNAAIYVDNTYITYEQLDIKSTYINDNLSSQFTSVGILDYRSVGYYCAVVSCVLSSRTFVPLGTKLPLNRLISIIEQSQLSCILFGSQYKELYQKLQKRFPRVSFLCIEELLSLTSQPKLHSSNTKTDVAYILFTSGTTGTPKGVPISWNNLDSYVTYMDQFLPLTPDDRVSQVFDPTFDLSIHDMFITWTQGACLYVLPETALFAPSKFIKQHELTIWFSVPSTASIMSKLGMLKKASYPSLRISLFCGEALPTALADNWHKAAYNSKIINLYGPTEATIACSHYEYNPSESTSEVYVPIGTAFPHMNFCTDKNGQLLISGPQVFSGYLSNTEHHSASLHVKNNIQHYCSGDLVRSGPNNNWHYVSRIDAQVKIQGYRVELAEINAKSSEFLNNALVQTIAIPKNQPQSLTIFICAPADKKVADELLTYLAQQLPHYMVPKKVIWIDSMPLNSNGKIDSNTLHLLTEK
ncbi:Gramicidin S synthase 1 [Pseudoalteromonas sp. CIP111854]|uniref:Gramicidin S synthase 1 n=1 Tax=Pseudoalteromonas holothuriae TaxID=2963714 RepID=A0A9W4QUB0_9GAMM|nr:AMP-binding protein [Pseudoalteromonas sp. CIP111854]CAH9053429.1 Gramicidin S synthase 1 [Pseudoalteromonas sp. CIP111854]